MAQYINFEAEAEFIDANSSKENDDEVSLISESDSLLMIKKLKKILIFIDSVNLVMLKVILMRF